MSLFEVGDRVRIKPFMRDFGTVTNVEEDHLTVVGASYNRGRAVRLRFQDVQYAGHQEQAHA